MTIRVIRRKKETNFKSFSKNSEQNMEQIERYLKVNAIDFSNNPQTNSSEGNFDEHF